MRSILDKKTSVDLVKLMIFLVVTALATGVLAVLIGNMTFQSSRTYSAIFSDATGLTKGDDIRIAGVRVGSVKDIQIYDTNQAKVTFSVATSATVTKSSQADIRYRNLVGQRYISINQGVGDTSRLAGDSTIPISRTQPALDLTTLFNGFQPLFTALTPSDINQLSYEIIQVFQGEGGNLQGLLQDTASLTNTLADRDQVIGSLIDNLNSVLTTIGSRDGQLNNLITQLQNFIHGLKQDRNALLNPLDAVSKLTDQTASLTAGLRPSFVKDVKQLRRVAKNLNKGRQDIDSALQILPIKLTKIGRTAIYGSFFNFYMCNLVVNIPLGLTSNAKHLSINYAAIAKRCSIS